MPVRAHLRAPRSHHRADDMLIIRGVNVFPSQVEHLLMQVPEVAPHYPLVLHRDGALDTLEIRVEAAAAPRTIERSVGKAKRVQDLRGTGGNHA